MNLYQNHQALNAVTPDTVLVWLRRDLRLTDQAALYHALREHRQVLPLFIFDTEILNKLDDPADSRVTFIYQTLIRLKQELEEKGSSLLVLHGNPVEIFKKLKPAAVYTNHDYEPYAIRRDKEVRTVLQAANVPFRTFKDQVLFEKNEVLKDDGQPYTVYTPYSKKWKALCRAFYLKAYPTEKYFHHLQQTPPLPFPAIEEIGFRTSHIPLPERKIPLKVIENYHLTRDYPGTAGTTRLSVHLRFGTVSIRQLAGIAFKKNEKWLNELIWRDFYQMILWHFPHVVSRAFKPEYDRIKWRNHAGEFEAWCQGRTGYPLVDAGMRELNATGYMHNRVRMVTASFLTKNLLIDWRWGEAYFAKKLLDFDLASNNGGWQWAAGSGCDAAPYFRVFNPGLQMEKFDPQRTYIKKWVPEYETPQYPKPIVDYNFARQRALKVYSEALGRTLE
ncbi:MAG: deoxyribodipyrimidine photo-lyase [Cyclobacteriaceae bacterium]|nr:MAG: deoxyribodipyrimidine photo-lyase [Cyclobacteriaceae bacterium]